jgi:hypothetical protein
VNSSEGVGLVSSRNDNQPERMIMTLDGGQHWRTVSF